MLCEKVLRGASADGWGKVALGEVGRLQGGCVFVAVDSHLVFQAPGVAMILGGLKLTECSTWAWESECLTAFRKWQGRALRLSRVILRRQPFD